MVTGGSSGIGYATARLLVDRGAVVSLIARGETRLRDAARKLGPTVTSAAADVADRAQLVAAIDTLVAQNGPVEHLVTSAGLARPGRFLELDDAVYREMMEVDYFGTLHAVRAVAPEMVRRGSGSIVMVSSGAALAGIYGYTAYGPAKWAVRGLAQALRAELAPLGVHVACVFPPDVDTPQLADENRYKPAETFAISGTVKPMHPDEVARSIVRAIERRTSAVYPSFEMRALAGVGPLLAPLLDRWVDRKVRQVARRG